MKISEPNLTKSDFTLLNYIRRNNGKFTKSELSERMNLPWATVSTATTNLSKNKMINLNKNNNETYYKGKLAVNSQFKYYVGISIGHSKIKITIIDFSLKVLKEADIEKKDEIDSIYNLKKFSEELEEISFKKEKDDMDYCKWCCQTPDSVPEIRNKMIEIVKKIIRLKNKDFCIDSIGLALPGHIDFEQQKVIQSFESNFFDTNIASILGTSLINDLNEKNIKIYIEHNVKASTIGEKEAMVTYRKEIDHENVINIYLGIGLSIGMIFSNTLYRGNNNIAGELGKCLINTKGGKILEDKLNDILYNNSNYQRFNDQALIELYKRPELDSFVDLICLSISNIVDILGINTIIFSGKFERFFSFIELKMMNKFSDMGKSQIILIKSYYGAINEQI